MTSLGNAEQAWEFGLARVIAGLDNLIEESSGNPLVSSQRRPIRSGP